MSNEINTRYFDDNGDPIFVGDTLKSQWDYEVIVYVKSNSVRFCFHLYILL